jgi:hypothetical protein
MRRGDGERLYARRRLQANRAAPLKRSAKVEGSGTAGDTAKPPNPANSTEYGTPRLSLALAPFGPPGRPASSNTIAGELSGRKVPHDLSPQPPVSARKKSVLGPAGVLQLPLISGEFAAEVKSSVDPFHSIRNDEKTAVVESKTNDPEVGAGGRVPPDNFEKVIS